MELEVFGVHCGIKIEIKIFLDDILRIKQLYLFLRFTNFILFEIVLLNFKILWRGLLLN